MERWLWISKICFFISEDQPKPGGRLLVGSKDLDSNCFLYLFSTSDLSDKRLKEGVGRKEDEKKKRGPKISVRRCTIQITTTNTPVTIIGTINSRHTTREYVVGRQNPYPLPSVYKILKEKKERKNYIFTNQEADTCHLGLNVRKT